MSKTIDKVAKRYRALVSMSLRRSPNPSSELYEQWHDWGPGDVFEAPAHLNVPLALERGIMEAVDG